LKEIQRKSEMRGGKRAGAGRPPGAPNKINMEREKAIRESGLTPLDYMLSILRDEKQPADRRDNMAKAAAPYVHPHLTSAQVTVTRNSVREKTDAELAEILAARDRGSARDADTPIDPAQLN
jgi:hypothetical protein